MTTMLHSYTMEIATYFILFTHFANSTAAQLARCSIFAQDTAQLNYIMQTSLILCLPSSYLTNPGALAQNVWIYTHTFID